MQDEARTCTRCKRDYRDHVKTITRHPAITMLVEHPAKGAEIAHYHFHLHDGAFVADREGIELPDWQAASDRALERASEVVKQRGVTFWKGEHLRIVVTDSVGTALFELRLSGHLPLEPHVSGPRDPILLN